MEKIEWHNEKRKLSDLLPASYNPRKMTEKQNEDLKKSLKKFNLAEVPVINTDNVILAGHQRIRVLADLNGMDYEIDVRIPNRLLTEKESKEYNVRSNKNTGEWDFDVMANNFDVGDLTDWGFDEKDLGFDIYTEEEKDDEVPEITTEPQTVLGDIYELGSHRVMCGDSTIEDDVLKLMDSKKADMVFTDPPYGVDYVSRVDKERRKEWGGIKNDDLKGKILQEFINDALGFHWQAKSKYVCCNWQSVKDFFDAVGMPNSLIVWDKKSIGLGANYRSQHEFILFWGQLDTRSESNVWSLKRDPTSEYTHPTQKPVELIQRAIINSSKPGELVFDAFLGSGSTLIACQKTNRVCYGMELDPKYVDVIIERYCIYTGNRDIVKNGQKITWAIPSELSPE
jgi:DNA modification methylase